LALRNRSFSHIYLLDFDCLSDWLDGWAYPRILGRKIEQREITLVSVIVLIHPLLILIPASITLAFPIPCQA
jgi:K+-transporting ATPase ATPase A chain